MLKDIKLLKKEKMRPQSPNGLIEVLILTAILLSFSYACIGEDGRVPPFRSIPIDLKTLPTEGKDWTGSNPTLVILIDFQNCAGTFNEGNWHTILLSAPNNPRFSMRDYYHEVSYFFTPGHEGLDLPPAWETFGTQNNGVVGWYRMPFNHPFTLSGGDTFWPNRTGRMHESVPDYAAGWRWGQQLALLALRKADQHINFALYGSPYGGQGSPWVVRANGLQIIVVVAGFEASYSGLQNFAIWRHYWFLPGMGYLSSDPAPEPYYQTYVGGRDYGGGYAMVGEKAPNGTIIGQGLVAHEVGHGLGLPDLYDTDGNYNYNGYGNGTGEWCLMAGADWLGNPAGTCPGHFCAWAKIDRGWLTPTLIWYRDSVNAQIPKVESVPVVYRMNPYNQPTSQQYFLIENRQKKGFDSLISGDGLLIYHIDEDMLNANRSSNTVNTRVGYTNSLHYSVDVECEDGFPLGGIKDHLDSAFSPGNRGDAGDPWNGGKDFNWQSIPNTGFYYGILSGVAVEKISESGALMTADLLYRLSADVGVISILAPTGEVKKDSSVIPSALVKNFGTNQQDFSVLMKIGDWTNTKSISLTAGELDTIYFDAWVASPTGNLTVLCTTQLNTDLRDINDFATGSVTVTSTPGHGWSKKRDVSNQPSGKSVKGGGGITALEGKNANIYLLLGNNTRDFLRYDLGGNSWSAVCSLPAGPNNKKVKKGAYLVDDETYIYAFKGGNTNEFYKYNPTNNSWSSLNEPNFLKGMRGGFACYVHHRGDYLYVGNGASNNEWQRYDIGTNTWGEATPTTLPVDKAKVGSGLTYDGVSKIYFLAGGGRRNYFYSLDLSAFAPEWIKLESLPLVAVDRKKKVREGGSIEFFDGKVYAVKGGNTKEFWSYDPTSNTWAYLGEIGAAKGIKCGRSLTSTADGIFCLIGNNTNEFWFYGGSKSFKTSEPAVRGKTILADKLAFAVIPNPTKGLTQVYYSLPKKEMATLKVYNTLGELVYSSKTDKGHFTIGKLPNGVYLLRLSAKGYKEERRLVVLR